MKKQQQPLKNTDLDVVARADKPVFVKNQNNTRIIEINLTPPDLPNENRRSPLNLGLVIDRSGSMEGDKLYFVRQAVCHMIDLLDEIDRASVVVYDDTVNILFPGAQMTAENKKAAKMRVQDIRSGGSTFLSGGWLKGCEEVARGAAPATTSRTLLLTDGLANRGIQSIDELATHAMELYRRGIATSCFGVGLGYNEHMLEAIANSGGGNFHFLETMNSIPLVFEREFENLVSAVLRDVEISLTVPSGVDLEVCSGWRMERFEERVIIMLGSLFAGQPRSVFLRINTAGLGEDVLTIPVTLRGKSPDEIVHEAMTEIRLTGVDAGREAKIEADKSLMERYAEVILADKFNEALKLERQGDRKGATHLMERSLKDNEGYLAPAAAPRYERFMAELEVGMSEEFLKRRHRQVYEIKQGRAVVRDYAVENVNDCLIVNLDGEFALIHSGIPVSIGNPRQWEFLDEFFQLATEYSGLTLERAASIAGRPVDLIIGADILGQCCLVVDLSGGWVQFSRSTTGATGREIQLELSGGVPVMECRVNGGACKMVLGSGSRLSLIAREFTTGLRPIGREDGYFPGAGSFSTEVFSLAFGLGEKDIDLRCGILPEEMELKLHTNGVNGVIGSELFEKFRITLNLPRKTLVMKEYQHIPAGRQR